jgi:threonine/homoserine/homoserine lactone efflux protein
VSPIGQQLLLLGGAYLAIETLVALGYAAVGARIGESTGFTAKSRRRLDRIASACFVLLAGYLLIAAP